MKYFELKKEFENLFYEAKIEETADWLMRSVIVDGKELWIYECSKCGCIGVKPKEHEYDNYCSNCGRHMDGGEK